MNVLIRNKNSDDAPFIDDIIKVAKETFSREYCHPPDYCPKPCGNDKCERNKYYVMDVIKIKEIRKIQNVHNEEISYEILIDDEKRKVYSKYSKIGYIFEELKEMEK